MATRLTRANTAATNRKKFTFSCWLKRGKLGNQENFFTSIHDGSNEFQFRFDSDDELRWVGSISGSAAGLLNTKRLFRDPGAWMHIVIAGDTTQATNINRLKLYINGTQIPDGDFNSPGYPGQDTNFGFGTTDFNFVFGTSSATGTNDPFTGLISHAHFIDGTAYDASTFGSTDSTTGEWQINTSPTVTYGNNGFFILKDGNSVTDQSGQSNNFTVSTGTLTNTEDNPSNVFAVLNPLDNPYNGEQATITNGNTVGQSTNSGFLSGASTIGASSGKYYAEFKLTAGDMSLSAMGVIGGQIDALGSSALHDYNKFYGVRGNGSKYQPGGSGTSSWASSYTTNDIISLAMDLDNNRLYVAKNGQYADGSGNYDEAFTGSPAYITLASDLVYHFVGGSISTGSGVYLTMQSNFGNGYFGTTAISSEGTNASGLGKFEYDVPAGYAALSTKGLNE